MTYSPKLDEFTADTPDKTSPESDTQDQANSKLNRLTVEMIKALTPIVLALIGGSLGIAVIFSDSQKVDSAAGFGLASAAIAGAAGLAQPYKEQDQSDH